ncbi:MAG: peptidoglycan D,D-transpeptidase FtsI family protein [Planctomycetota bacterium]|jgi:penicillin-binding protein 2
MSQQKLQGSMFHRRLALLWVAAAVVTLLLMGQMTKLAVGQGEVRRAAAHRRLDLVTVLPTTRGRILDRHGRVLAVDRPSYDVAVSYDVITGAWALKQAAARARSAQREAWPAMSPQQRDEAIARHLPHFQEQIDAVWEAVVATGGIDRPELERRLDAIKQQVQTTAAAVWDRQFRREVQLGRASDDDAGFRPRPIREQRDRHVILPRVPNKVAFAFRRLAEQLPGLEVQDAQRRDYPWTTAEVTLDRSTLPRPVRSSQTVTIAVEGVADHILGSMRDEVWAADVERRPFMKDLSTGASVDLGGYRIGDAVGHRGLERAYEDHLRGTRGLLRKRLDSGQVERERHQPGQDLHLTLDIALQAQVQAILSPQLGLATVQQWHAGWSSNGQARPTGLPHGTPLNSAAVVLDVQSGEILAIVATPTLALGRAAPWSCRDGDLPPWNRPAEVAYAPGSIVKPLVLAAAVSEGVHGLDEPIVCGGHYLPDRQDVARCWVYRAPIFGTHGPLQAEEAIARSCNIFFYTLGDKLGMPRLSAWLRRFGLGSHLDVGLLHATTRDGRTALVGESAGSLPGEEDMTRLALAGELRFASVILGTGQGPVTWTPVQAANAYATLARGGTVRDPTLIAHRGERLVPPRPELSLDEALVERILKGLRAAVSEPHGTGDHISYPDGTRERIINAEGVTVWGKTGTAQAPSRKFDLDCDGTIDLRLDDPSHAWFVGLVGAGTEDAEPAFAIAVIVEYGGSGGRTAGPIANQIIRALKAEGYLTPPTS